MGALPLTLVALHRARQRVTPGTAGPLTASEWAENVAGHPLDEWQKTFLDDPADDQLLLCSRQVGKTLATSLRSGWIVRNGGLVIAIAPTQRQSSLVFGLLSAHLQADGADVMRATQTTIELGNGGIAHCLPGDRPSSIRGLTLRHGGPSALVIDEAAYIRESLWPSLSPMLAAAPDAGQIMLTTPCGPAGRFHAAWTDPDADEWSRVKVTAYECPRISEKFLRSERARLGDEMFRQPEPSEAMLTASLGVGKTRRLAAALAAWAALNPTRRALVRVPTHELAADLRGMIEARSPGISGVHHGLERPDPNAEGALMCRRIPDVTTARRAGGTTSTICGSEKRGLCPHHPDNPRVEKPCGYLTQDNRDAQIVLVAGDVSLGNAPPRGIQRRGGLQKESGQRHFDVLIVDETSPASMLVEGAVGLDLIDETELSELATASGVILSGKDAALSFNERADLRAGLIHVRAGLEAEPLRSFNFNPELVRSTRTLVWRIAVGIDDVAAGRSGVALERALAKPGQINRAVRKVATLLSAILQGIGDGTEGLPHVNMGGGGEEGGPRKTVYSTARQRIAVAYGGEESGPIGDEESDLKLVGSILRPKGEARGFEWAEGVFSDLESAEEADSAGVAHDPVHVLILDATGSPGPLRKWWPRLELLGDVRAMDAPGVVRCQLSDSAMAYRKCIPNEKRPDDAAAIEAARTLRVISEIRRAQAGGRAGWIGPKDLAAWYDESGLGFGPETAIGWFGNIRGSNAMTGVSSLVVASRPAINATELERKAAVLFGRDVTPEETYTNGGGRIAGSRARLVTMRDGTARRIMAAGYRDERSEAVRRMISDHEVAQAEGRARSIRWTGPGPLLIDVITNGADVGPVDRLIAWNEYRAAGGWIGDLLLAGLWASGKGRSELLVAALRSSELKPVIPIEDIHGNDGVEARWLEAELSTARAVGLARRRLVGELDAAFRENRDPIVLNAPFPARGWHRVSVRAPGARYAPTAHIRSETPDEALERARELWPHAALTLIPKGETA